MEKSIRVVSPFKHADGIHPVEFAPGDYDVVEGMPGPGQVSARCAEVALAEGWAVAGKGTSAAAADNAGDINATDGALAAAAERGVDLAGVIGSGAGGRILVKDVDKIAAGK